jgi:hypothetical protein
MPTHADHAVENLKNSYFLKQVKNTQRVKILENRFGNLQMVSKITVILVIFDLALKKMFFCAGSACTISKFSREKNFEIMTKKKQFRIFYDSPKVAYPLRLYGIKITRIHVIENLTLGHL